ncbi:MAG: Sjogren's syndrome/scleroderma autoantigen 1 family protein [Haloarculaceae archaeon]
MSDFDKEAEREKLREKYERDQESRETAEKMSELLLQGATMTNAHCSACGDPIFRYDGQEFCATCEKPVDREDADEAGGDAEGTATDEKTEQIEVTSPSDDARVQFGSSEAKSEARDDDTADRGATAGRQARNQQQPQPETEPADRPARRPDPDQASEPPRPSQAGDVSAARESLTRTLARFSERAETTEDPQRAREHLAAAREAAETLSALRR